MTDDTTVEDRPPRPRGELAVGEHLGRYRLEAVLGAGGMGVVWSARDPDLDRSVAIKVLQARDAVPAQRTRLLREARAMARLRHPNVLTVYEVATAGDRDFIAMERVDGGNLDAWLASRPPRAEVMAALLAAGRGLAAAHAAGLVHRDFKPHNVLRDHDGRVLVTDFGLARGIADDTAPGVAAAATPQGALDGTLPQTPSTPRPADSVLDAPLTQTGALVGTPAYMAPEQLAGTAADARSDQFAYCVTLWQGLTGERPFRGASLDELRAAITAGLGERGGELDPDLRRALIRGLAVEPARRWPDMPALLAAIAGTGRPRRRWLLVTGGALLAAGIGVAAIASRGRGRSDCEAAETAFGGAWTVEGRGMLTPAIVAPLAGLRDRWLAAWSAGCSAGPVREARLGCLRDVRDELAAVVIAIDRAPRAQILAMIAELPRLDRCEQAAPFAEPAPPQLRRAAILALRAQLVAARVSPGQLERDASILQARAAGLEWEPLVAEVDQVLGHHALATGNLTAARERLDAAILEAGRSGHDRVGVLAQIDRLALERIAAQAPADESALPRMLGEIRSAVRRLGDEPHLAALADLAEGQLDNATDPLNAIVMGALGPQRARKQFAAEGDLPLLAVAIVEEIEGELRAPYQDIARVDAALREVLPLFGPDVPPAVERSAARVAWLQGDLAAVHRLLDDAHGDRVAAPGTHLTGRVVAADGTAVAGARVVAWRGVLRGDAERAYVDPAALVGDVVFTDATGGFSITVPDGGAVIAEAGALRSVPQRATPGLTLALVATDALANADLAFQVGRTDVIARFAIGDNEWLDAAPIVPEGYRLAGIPPGGTLGALQVAGAPTTLRRTTGLSAVAAPSPAGLARVGVRALDVIVRVHGPATATRDAWAFPGTVAPKTRADIERLAHDAADVSWGVWSTIGADTSEPGRPLYQAGDRHIWFGRLTMGHLTVCVATDAAPAAPVTCEGVELRALELVAATTIEP